MAMRATIGSLRLTKYIDFDRDPSLGQDSLQKGLKDLLLRAAIAAGLRNSRVSVTKDTRTTTRVRLAGTTAAGDAASFDVEVSGRTIADPANLRKEIVVPPPTFSTAPFPVLVYTLEALAAMTVFALMSERRNAPRNLYDLRDLIHLGADPSGILAQQDPAILQEFARRSEHKPEGISYALVQQELLPFIAPDERAALTEEIWLEITLLVAEQVRGWCQAALASPTRTGGDAPEAFLWRDPS